MALGSQANTHGSLLSPATGLHGAQLYLIFLRCSSFTVAIVPPSMSYSFSVISSTLGGHASTHLLQPSHLSVSTIMK